MATRAENLSTALDQMAARLAELDAVPIATRVYITYSIDGISYDWNGYRNLLVDAMAKMFPLIQYAGGPFDVWS